MNLVNRMMVQVDHNLVNQRGMLYNLLVHVLLETEVSIMAEIRRTSRLDQPNPKVVWHKEVVGLLHVVGVVETTSAIVLMSSRVCSSAVKRGTTYKSFVRISREVKIWEIEPI